MISNSVVVLGIPIDNLSLAETVESIFKMIDDYANDKRPRFIATVNVDFVVNTLTWRLQNIKHPELINILRRSDLVTPDGMPIVWASKLLGTPLKERVTGADLTPKLAEESAKRDKSIYFLGGRDDIGEQAASKLKTQYPDLIIAGIDSPYIHTEGCELIFSEQTDQDIVEKINKSGADILLIAFGNPKQEIWFNRNKNKLRVPVSIGIGGTFEFIIGTVSRAPMWMQNSGLEFLYRLTQQPGKLWKRYFVGFFKFGIMICPAIVYYRYSRFLYDSFSKNNTWQSHQKKNVLNSEDLQVDEFKLPNRLDATVIETLFNNIDQLNINSSQIILNFSNVQFIDSAGLGFLLNLWRKVSENSGELCFSEINQTVKQFFKFNRVIDLFGEKIVGDNNEALTLLHKRKNSPSFYNTKEDGLKQVVLKLFGRLDATQMANLDIELINNEIGKKDCIIDLSNLTFVDSTGLIFFFKMQRAITANNSHLTLCGLTESVLQVFKITKLDKLFKIVDNKQVLEKVK